MPGEMHGTVAPTGQFRVPQTSPFPLVPIAPFTGPDTGSQFAALEHLTEIAAEQEDSPYRPREPGRPGRARRPGRRWRLDPLLRRWQRVPLLRRVPLPLAAVLVVQAALSLRLVWSNTAFADEALYLWAGHLEWAHWLRGGDSELVRGFPTFFSGAPTIYPPLGALADSLGGLAAARLLSLGFMLGATALLYAATHRLFDARAAGYAVALFAGIGSTQFLGAFATYDAMALFFLAVAAWAGTRAADARAVGMAALLALSGLALAVADAAKYASTIFDAVVIGLTGLALWRARSLRVAVTGALVVLGITAAVVAALLVVGGGPFWQGVEQTTLSRVMGTTPIMGVLFLSAQWAGGIMFLGICGALATAWSPSRPTRLLGCLLVLAVFLAPVEQARIHTMVSLFKHVDYGAWFGCVAGGYALASLHRTVPSVKAMAAGRVSSAAAAVAALAGCLLASAHFAGWPNTTRMLADIAPDLSAYSCPCLVTQNNAMNYYLGRQAFGYQLVNTYSFYYWDIAHHREVNGIPAYQAAIADGYFGVVEIDPSLNAPAYEPIVKALAATMGYRLVSSSPSGVAGEPMEIWVLTGEAT